MLKEVPSFDRPREKAIKYGVKSLSNIELLAIILRTGTKDENVLMLARKILYSLEKVSNLKNLSIEELIKIKGIGSTKAVTIIAAIELGIRILEEYNVVTYYKKPIEIFNYFYPKLRGQDKENLIALYLNTKGGIIKEKLISLGDISSSLFDSKDILKWALKYSASAIILIHNHPSGDPTPSIADLKATSNFLKQAKLLDIVVLDHIIIGETYYSMKENSKVFNLF